MPAHTNPTDIARETLKLLAQRRLVPTPANYEKIYCEIAGIEPEAAEESAGRALLAALHTLSKKSPALAKRSTALEKVIAEQNWAGFEAAFSQFVDAGVEEEGHLAWGELIRDLLKQWQIKHRGFTTRHKQDALERVLINFGSDPAALHQKVKALIGSWSKAPAQEGVEVQLTPEALPPEARSGEEDKLTQQQFQEQVAGLEAVSGNLVQQWRDLLGQALEYGVAPRLTQFPELSDQAVALAKKSREAATQQAFEALAKEIKQFWFKLELLAENDADVLAGLLRLLKLLIDNIGELIVDDQWLRGQIAVVQDVIVTPVNSRALFEAERSFKEVVFKQGQLKHSLNEAKATLKSMVTTFIDRLGEMSESTSDYHDKIESFAVRISQTEDINQLNDILADLSKETRGIQLDIQRSRDELMAARKQVEEAENKIHGLERELEAVSEKVREDHLTGTLNRRGLEDAMEREMARSERTHSPLCLALLDLDHFKKLNDTYGHQAGDEALLHLVRVVKEIMRPTDVIARFGGEEFIILLPDTGLSEAVQVMTRLQRELTKKFFLHNNERILITFSAGVALRSEAESSESVIARADSAVYQAKSAGRNRVIAAQ